MSALSQPALPTHLGLVPSTFGIGSVILKAESPDLIEGVAITPHILWPDDRGYFLEILRFSKDAWPATAGTGQLSCALSYPGTIKAFHYHVHQTDLWSAAVGMLQVVLVDLRRESSTFGERNTIYAGTLRPWQIRIPPGVAHGYKVIGSDPAVMVYVTDRHYDPSDEGRIPHNDPSIHYDWELQHK